MKINYNEHSEPFCFDDESKPKRQKKFVAKDEKDKKRVKTLILLDEDIRDRLELVIHETFMYQSTSCSDIVEKLLDEAMKKYGY